MDMPTKPLQKLKKKDVVAQNANIKSANCFLKTNSPNITLANKYSCTVCQAQCYPIWEVELILYVGPIYFMRIKFCEFCILSNIN